MFNLIFFQGMKQKAKKSAENLNKEDVQHSAQEHTEAREQNTEAEQTDDKAEVEDNDSDSTSAASAFQENADNLQNSLNEANDKFLRLFSEFDNYRKRVARERIELTKTASESVILALLPVLDDLERASNMSSDTNDADTGKEGITLIYNKFKSILRQKGVEEIVAIGEDFDTDYHDAITHIEAKDKKQKGKIVEEIQKGYLLNGKVIRHARVIVAN